MNWRELNRTLSVYSEQEVLEMLKEERNGKQRVTFLARLHQRYNALRAGRERMELLKGARRL